MRLLERDDGLALLASRWEQAQAGGGSLVLVGGESGAGKTALVQAGTEDAASAGRLLWGACDPLSTPRPLGPLHDVADLLGERAGDLLRGPGQSHEIFGAVCDRLRARATVLVVDDLHWADQGTIDLLRFLLRRLASSPSLVIGTLRRDEIGATHPLRALLGDVARSPDATSVDIAPLSVEAVRTLAGARAVDAERLHRQTGGNAFFVAEMLDHAGPDLPATVRDAVLARTAGLGDDARRVLDLLACAPEGIADRLLPVLGIGLPPLRAVADAGLVTRGRRGVAFRHDLCRLAVAGALPPGAEAALHRRMFEALEQSAMPPDHAVLAHHALGAGDAANILRHAALAGVQAARSGAHAQAAEFFLAALDADAPGSPVQEAELLERLAEEWYLLDRLDRAIDACRRAMQLREAADDASAVSANHHALSVYHWYNADRAEAEHHASAAEAVLEGHADPLRLAHAHAMQAYLALQSSELAQARATLERARAVAAAVDDRQLKVRIELIDGMTRLAAGEMAGRQTIVSTLESAHEDFDEVYSSGFSNLSYYDVEQRRFEIAADVLAVSLPITIERDLPICRVWQLGSRGRLRLLGGDWGSAVADAETVLGARPTSAPLARTWPHLVRGLVALRRGEESDDLDTAWELAQRFGEPLRLLPAASALVERAWLLRLDDPRIAVMGSLLRQDTVAGLDWARGDLAVWLARVVPDLDLSAVEVAEPHRLQLDGDHRAAADLWARLAAPYEQALALVDHGGPDEVRTAVDLLDRLGADAVAARVRQDLRGRGVATIPTRRRPSTRSNVAGLTARELEVLRLLGEGMTNAEVAERLFISRKTADHHVSAILSKLQVTGRRQAVRAASDLEILG